MEAAIFFIFAGLAVICGLNVVLLRHPIASALWLIGVMISLAVLYALLGAHFLAVAQVIVYAGAVMVLFVMVIMLVNAGAERPSRAARLAERAGLPLLAGLLAALGHVVWRAVPGWAAARPRGTARDVGLALFQTYLLPFEATSLLVLIAIVGAVVLAYKEKS